jgi:hypothetical protein
MDAPSSYEVVVAGHRAKLKRDGLGYSVTFDDPLYGEVTSLGFAAVALAKAEAHVRGIDERVDDALTQPAPSDGQPDTEPDAQPDSESDAPPDTPRDPVIHAPPSTPRIDTAVRLLDLFDDDDDD